MSDTKKCPFCAEDIKAEAIKCRYCGERLEALPQIKQPSQPSCGEIKHSSRSDVSRCSDGPSQAGDVNTPSKTLFGPRPLGELNPKTELGSAKKWTFTRIVKYGCLGYLVAVIVVAIAGPEKVDKLTSGSPPAVTPVSTPAPKSKLAIELEKKAEERNKKMEAEKKIRDEKERKEREKFAEEAAKRIAEEAARPDLKVLTFEWREEYGYLVMEGEVKNTSSGPLENVQAIGIFSEEDGTFVKSDDALIEYNPILPGQTSPFKIMTTNNPAIQKARPEFKTMFGGALDVEYVKR